MLKIAADEVPTFVTTADDPAAPVVTVPTVIVAAVPLVPLVPAAPVAPVSPRGIPKFKIADDDVPEFVTVTLDPGDPVETAPTVMVADVPLVPGVPGTPLVPLVPLMPGSPLMFPASIASPQFVGISHPGILLI